MMLHEFLHHPIAPPRHTGEEFVPRRGVEIQFDDGRYCGRFCRLNRCISWLRHRSSRGSWRGGLSC
jgi:hypothetical protein